MKNIMTIMNLKEIVVKYVAHVTTMIVLMVKEVVIHVTLERVKNVIEKMQNYIIKTIMTIMTMMTIMTIMNLKEIVVKYVAHVTTMIVLKVQKVVIHVTNGSVMNVIDIIGNKTKNMKNLIIMNLIMIGKKIVLKYVTYVTTMIVLKVQKVVIHVTKESVLNVLEIIQTNIIIMKNLIIIMKKRKKIVVILVKLKLRGKKWIVKTDVKDVLNSQWNAVKNGAMEMYVMSVLLAMEFHKICL